MIKPTYYIEYFDIVKLFSVFFFMVFVYNVYTNPYISSLLYSMSSIRPIVPIKEIKGPVVFSKVEALNEFAKELVKK